MTEENRNPFEKWFKCKICGEFIKEGWIQGVYDSTTTTTERMKHMINHTFEEIK